MIQKFETNDLFRKQSIKFDEQQISVSLNDLFIGEETWFHKLDEIIPFPPLTGQLNKVKRNKEKST